MEVDGQPIMLLARDFDVPMFVHEATHVAACVLRSRGVPFTDANEETVAHMIEWIVRVLLPPAQAWAAPPLLSPLVGVESAAPEGCGTVQPR